MAEIRGEARERGWNLDLELVTWGKRPVLSEDFL